MALLIGRIYLERSQLDEGYAILQESVNNYPFAFDARTALITLVNDGIPVNEFQRGLINFNFDNFPLAIEAFNRYLDTNPETQTDATLWYLGRALREDGRVRDVDRTSDAIAVWQRLITEYPTSDFYVDAWQSIEFTQWAYMDEPQLAAETSLTYVAQRPESPQAPDFLFLAGRSYERAGMLQEASDTWLRIGSEYPGSAEAFRGTYFAGIAQVRLGDWVAAQPLFSRALVLASQPAEEAAAYLWLGKTQEALGDISAALDSWKLSQTANPFGHYSIRAEDLLMQREPFSKPESYTLDPDLAPFRLEAETWLRETFELPPDINLESPGMLAYDPRYQRGLEFWALGDYQTGKTEFDSIRLEYAQDPAQTFRLIPALVEIGLYRSALAASTQLLRLAGLEGGAALSAPEFFSRIRFGAYYLDWLLPIAESENISPLLVLSVIRQESAYEGFAQSGAGARGLMQIMEATGEQLATELGWPPDFSADDLNRPHVSLVLGTRYLKQRLQMLDGDITAALAAYNGGIGNVLVWRDLAPNEDTDLFLETVRLEETRNYIRLINEIHYIYGWLYSDSVVFE
jgi:soluble lytic murein transglycosylase